MLSITQTQTQIKPQSAIVANPPNLGNWLGINEAYGQLKALGWQSVSMHPSERVPVFQLEALDAFIWRDKSREFDWIVQTGEHVFGMGGHLADITADVRRELTPNVTVLNYDRHAKEWEARNHDQTRRFPAGYEGRREAELYALSHDCPAVLSEVEALIDNADALHLFDTEAITRRAIKAGFIIRDGKLWPAMKPGEVARVDGTEDEPYRITGDGERLYCDCPDFVGERSPVLPSGQQACKHIMAVQMAAALVDSPVAE